MRAGAAWSARTIANPNPNQAEKEAAKEVEATLNGVIKQIEKAEMTKPNPYPIKYPYPYP